MSVYKDDTIAAISTALGTGGIGIIRISGKSALPIADKIFKSSKKPSLSLSHTVLYGKIQNPETGAIIDEVLLTVMRAPKTYTKEDVVEINCHGGVQPLNKILETVVNNGARLAEPGEFTKRAFLNGRIDLTQAEAVIDIINSKTDAARQTAVNQLGGGLNKKIKEIRGKVLDVIASIEAGIDYPDENLDTDIYNTSEKSCNEILEELRNLLKTADTGKIIRDGVKAVILGKPNVGKSSLLNTFLDEERAIVTNIPGTTRDTVEEFINVGGIPVKIIDTAGIRDTDNDVEKIGVEKSKAYAKAADVVLMMLDSSRELDLEDIEILKFIKNKKSIVIINKIDLEKRINTDYIKEYIENNVVIEVSVNEGLGMDKLYDALKTILQSGDINVQNDVIISNVRHKNALVTAKNAVLKTLETISLAMPVDFISMDLQIALSSLGEITGENVDGEIIDRIFTKFCLGK